MVTLQNGSGLLAGSIGTGVGFGQTESTQLAAGEQVGQILALLLLGAVLKNGRAAKRGVSGNDDSRGAAHLGQLLHAHGIGENVAAGAAVLLGEINTQHPQLGHLFDGLHGETLLFVEFLSQRLNLILCELAVHLTEHLLLVCQMKIHTTYSFLLNG